MRLIDALELSRQASSEKQGDAHMGVPFRFFVACGFTPLHLATYLTAYVSQRLPHRRILAETGLFGDLAGTLEAAAERNLSAVAVFVEWGDLDPRLSARQAPPAGGVSADEIVRTAAENAARFRPRLENLAFVGSQVAVALPTVPPLAWGHQTDALETGHQLELDAIVNQLGRECVAAGLRVVSRRTLDQRSPVHGRHDIKAELLTGFPYTLAHTAVLAEIIARALVPETPKKAVITDLDDTLWSGVVGEVGPEQLAWSLDKKASMHGHYQQTLAALAAAGVLIGAASKNDAAIADAALSRMDLVIPRECIFPVEAHWTPKSQSVARMLGVWNIGPEAVVFVDDCPMELAEVQQAFPTMTCLRFPREDPAAVVTLLSELRNLCGRMQVADEDRLRSRSLQQGQHFLNEGGRSSDTEQFLSSLNARITFEDGAADPRSLELVNKTNQFNLHGMRYAEDEWRTFLARAGAFVWTVSYEDRFGSLGKIAVLAGEKKGGQLFLRDMVLSCRAFSRRVEYAALRCLMESLGASTIQFFYRATDRNGPLREFLATVLGSLPQTAGNPVLTQSEFEAGAPPLYHDVAYKTHA